MNGTTHGTLPNPSPNITNDMSGLPSNNSDMIVGTLQIAIALVGIAISIVVAWYMRPQQASLDEELGPGDMEMV